MISVAFFTCYYQVAQLLNMLNSNQPAPPSDNPSSTLLTLRAAQPEPDFAAPSDVDHVFVCSTICMDPVRGRPWRRWATERILWQRVTRPLRLHQLPWRQGSDVLNVLQRLS